MATGIFYILGFILTIGGFALSAPVWTDWTTWSSCNCDGEQYRVRQCYQFHPAGPPTPETSCHGLNVENKSCIKNETACRQATNSTPTVSLISTTFSGVWTTWIDLTHCSKPCSNSTRVRVRNCTNVEYTKLTNDCPGSSVDYSPCPQINCTNHGVWTTWIDLTHCSEPCSNSTRIRVRNCTNVENTKLIKDCPGSSVDNSPCPQINCTNHGVWQTWSEWTHCSELCSNSTRIRVRNCTNVQNTKLTNDCPGGSVDYSPCPQINCTNQGVWNVWSDWSNCSEPCSNSVRIRVRNCTNVEDTKLTNDCQGPSVEHLPCPEISCTSQVSVMTTTPPVSVMTTKPPGVWNTWSDWSNCSEPCSNSVRIRVRNCTNVEDTKLTNDCQGSSVEHLPCPEISCTSQVSVMSTTPPDSWTNWSSWISCTVTCGGGVTYRTRDCTSYNHNQANDCHGNSIETESCSNNVCNDLSKPSITPAVQLIGRDTDN